MIANGFRRLWPFCFWLLTGDARGQSAGAALPLKTGTDASLWQAGLQSLVVGVVLLVIAGGLLWWLRSRQLPSGPGEKRRSVPLLLLSRRLTRNTVLLVVQWEDKTYLLAENGSRVQLLDSRGQNSDVTRPERGAATL